MSGHQWGVAAVASDLVRLTYPIRFGDDFDLDPRAYELRRAGRVLKLERIPMELLLLLIEKKGQLVTRDQIIERIWGKDVFLDTDNSINAAIRKIRQVLKDDPERPRFVQTITGRGYRFIAPVVEAGPALTVEVAAQPQALAAGSLIGKQISHYRILSELGSGGMGVVYQAEDIRLGRRVALKFLPEKLACDQRALKRFEREARAASSLNHPNICTIYEVEEHDHQPVIVMELLEGTSLKQRIREGPISVDELLDFGIQASDALEAAHAKGIVHRDIKPANLFIVGHGRMKVLDFGLAKVCDLHVANDQPEEEALTLDGVIPGTTSYMSPEQVRGEEIDARSDLFSLGVVLYEMATGQKPFIGKNRVILMNAILNAQPTPASRVNSSLPAALDSIIAKALEKKREKRFQHATDICSDLKQLKRETQKTPTPVAMAGAERPNAQPVGHVFTRYLAREFAAIRDRFSEKPVKQVEPRPMNLLVQRTGFVGRKKEVAALKELLMRPDVRLVTVTGPGGIGKTRLAVQVAGEVEHFPGGTHFVPLSSLGDPGLVASAIVQTLGIREAGGKSALEILRKNLQDASRAPMLLLLDNFEHLIQAAPMVADLLAAAPNLKIMVTSQAALHVYGEHEFPVPPLTLPDSRSKASVEVLSQCPAVALFVQRAVAAKPDFELNPQNAAAVSEICAWLDGLPLAIELAAARVKVLSPSLLLTRLVSRLQTLTGGARDLPQRQQTLRAAMDWSYDLLSASEQRLFRRLSVFVGGCTLEGVEAVCDTKGDLGLDVLDAMASMVDKSLVQQVKEVNPETRFLILSTIREYALERLAESDDEPATRRAHAAYYLVLAEEGAEDAVVHPEWLDRFEVEHDNFRMALDYLIKTGDAEWGLRLGTALFRFWETREYLSEGRDTIARLLALEGAGTRPKLRARLLFAAAVLAGEQGDYDSARQMFQDSLECCLDLNDNRGVAVALNALAVNARDRGELAEATLLFERCVVIWKDLGDSADIARALSNLASVMKLQGDYARAFLLYDECLTMFRKAGDAAGVAWTLNYLGDVAREKADFLAARSFCEQSLAAFRQLRDGWGMASALADLAGLSCDQGNTVEARRLYGQSITMFQQLGHKRGIARALECLAVSAAAQSNAEQSLHLAGAAAALRQRLGAPLTLNEQPRLEKALEFARRTLGHAAGLTAWMEGWAMPVEQAVNEALNCDAEARLQS
jgi:predicted ATPase/DNA-binding winged helix-turn-helix (wHTH) protein